MRARPAAQNRPYFSPFNISTVSGFVLLFAFSLDGALSKNLACDFSSTPAASSVQELAHRSGVIIEGKVQVEGLESDVNQEEREILLRERAEAKGKESQGEEMDGNEKTTQELLSNRTSFLEPYLLKVRVRQVWAVKAGGIKKNSIISLIVDSGSHCFTLKNDTRYIFFMQPTNDTSVFKAAFQPLEAGRKARKDVSRVLCQRCRDLREYDDVFDIGDDWRGSKNKVFDLVAAGSIYMSQSQWTMEESSKLPDAYEGVELVVSRYPHELNNHRTLGMFDGVFSLYNKHHL